MRGQLVRPEPPVWSGYTCFAAIANVVPHDIKEVGYKVFLGSRKYFVSVDVGGGRIQWYAFLNIPPGGVPEHAQKGEGALDFLRPELEGWSEEVFQLINNTPIEEASPPEVYRCRRASSMLLCVLIPGLCTCRWSSATCTTAHRSSTGRRGTCAYSVTRRTR